MIVEFINLQVELDGNELELVTHITCNIFYIWAQSECMIVDSILLSVKL